ncbi:MAG: DUF2071 domain-containing protein, partial [Ferruginibacter sp.]
MDEGKVFLAAEWNDLLMINYSIDPEVLKPFLPTFTEIDLEDGHCYISMVGFRFEDVRLKNISIPFHRNFPEVNLRFYVRRFDGKKWRRGVVFISEIVPLPAISFIANSFYGEKYKTLPMRA